MCFLYKEKRVEEDEEKTRETTGIGIIDIVPLFSLVFVPYYMYYV